MLHKEKRKRLGSGENGSEDIKGHKWFKTINWKKLDSREIKPSFVPRVLDCECTDNFEECWTAMPAVDSPAATPKTDQKDPFGEFEFVGVM